MHLEVSSQTLLALVADMRRGVTRKSSQIAFATADPSSWQRNLDHPRSIDPFAPQHENSRSEQE
jgi:hypothetical protein